MQNLKQKFRHGSTVFKKPGIVQKFEKFDKLHLSYSSIFFAETLHTSPTQQCLQKSVSDVFHFVQILNYWQKLKKTWFLHSLFTLLLISQDLNKIKKIPRTLLQTLLRQKTCAKFQQKILNSMVVCACQSFQFFRQKTQFLRNRGLP